MAQTNNTCITPAQLNRIQRFLSMNYVRNAQKTFLRGYLARGANGATLTKKGARTVIAITIRQLEADGYHLNRPSMQDNEVLFSDMVAFGD